MGLAHQEFDFRAFNITPFGAVIAAPRPKDRELFCREGLRLYARIKPERIRAALAAVEKERTVLRAAQPGNRTGQVLQFELDLAARMAEESCRIMLWQQALAAGRSRAAKALAKEGIKNLLQLDEEYDRYWPIRNKGTTEKSSAFLKWRTDEYRRGKLAFPPRVAKEPDFSR